MRRSFSPCATSYIAVPCRRIRLLKFLLHRSCRVTACGSISEAAEILQNVSIRSMAPDIIIMSAHLLREGGASVYASIVERFPGTKLTLMSCDHDIDWLVARLESQGGFGNCTTV